MGRGRVCRVSRGEWGEGGSEGLVGDNGAREDLKS